MIIYSVGVAGIMICLSSELGSVFIEEENSALYISLLAPLIPVMYLDTSVDSILKGLGYQLYSMIINIADATMSVILVWILLPKFGIMGYIATVYFTEILNAVLSITKLLLVTRAKIKVFDLVIKPLLSIIAASVLAHLFITYFQILIDQKLTLFICVAAIAILYFSALCLLHAISPKGIKKSITNLFKAKEKSR